MSVDQSDGLSMEIDVLYLSHAMLVQAELTVCSTRGFACILAYCDESLLHMEVPRSHVINEPTHTLEGEMLAQRKCSRLSVFWYI